jgi:hypothetical protein
MNREDTNPTVPQAQGRCAPRFHPTAQVPTECLYCRRVMNRPPEPGEAVSHGCCDSCLKRA